MEENNLILNNPEGGLPNLYTKGPRTATQIVRVRWVVKQVGRVATQDTNCLSNQLGEAPHPFGAKS